MSRRPALRLFPLSFLNFLAGFLVLLVFLAAMFGLSYQVSARQWNNVKLTTLESAIVRAVAAGSQAGPALLPQDSAIFVYDPAREFLFSNRGGGRRRAPGEGELRPLQRDGQLLAWYSAGGLEFHEDSANLVFLQSMGQAVALTAGLALALAMLLAWRFARLLSRPAASLQRALQELSAGRLERRIVPAGPLELRAIAAAANDLAALLAQEHEVRKQWVQDIVHDLRTPVSGLLSQFDAMVDGVLPASPERLARLKAEVERIGQLVAAFEELMRLEAPGLRVTWQDFAAASFVTALQERFRSVRAGSGPAFVTDCRVERLAGDEALLFRAVSNLLDNAFKYGQADQAVSLALRPDGGSVRLTVHNYGPPIPADQLARLCERSYRGDYARSSDGFGLGLTIARQVVELHGGRLTLHSSAAAGTSFSLVWPQSPASDPPAPAGPA